MNRKKEQRPDEEIRHHLEAEARYRRSDGLAPGDADKAAMRDLGNVGLIKEATREVWGWTSVQRLAQDIRYGLRMMRRSSGVSALAVASLAAGIGANTTVYTIVRAVLSPPAAVPEASRVMNFQRRDSGGSKLLSVNYPDWLARDGKHRLLQHVRVERGAGGAEFREGQGARGFDNGHRRILRDLRAPTRRRTFLQQPGGRPTGGGRESSLLAQPSIPSVPPFGSMDMLSP